MNGLNVFVYLAAATWLWLELRRLLTSCSRMSRGISGHYALLGSYALQGLISMLFALVDIPMTYISLAIAVVLTALTLQISVRPLASDRHETDGPGVDAAQQILITRLIIMVSYVSALGAGLALYTVHLVPSSMTGDPARHFSILIDMQRGGDAYLYKPIFYLWSSVITSMPLPLQRDQLFLLFTVLSLGLSTASVGLLAQQLVTNLRWEVVVVVALLTSFGYHFFALQYGYYALLLSSAFLFSGVSLLIWELKDDNIVLYAFASLLLVGVILTHSYFAPIVALNWFGMVFLRAHFARDRLLDNLLRAIPFWMFSVLVLVYSNLLIGENAIVVLGDIVQGRGFGTRNFWGNVLPFLALSTPLLLRARGEQYARAYVLSLLSVLTFTFIMWYLSMFGRAHDYYVYRNLMILLPLLVVGFAELLARLHQVHRTVGRVMSLTIATAVVAPYSLSGASSLASGGGSYLALLRENSGFLYRINPRVAASVPLEITAADRDILVNFETRCNIRIPPSLAIIGSDHIVPWIANYTGVKVPLVGSWSQVMDPAFNMANYERWRLGPSGRLLVMATHFVQLTPDWVLAGIDQNGALVCKGDSFAVYRRSSLERASQSR